MTELEHSISRLTAWLREFGESSTDAFKADLTAVLMKAGQAATEEQRAARLLHSLTSRNAELTEAERQRDAAREAADTAQPKAALWDGLLSADRIRFVGGANLGTPHMFATFEMWRQHPAKSDDQSEARGLLEQFARWGKP